MRKNNINSNAGFASLGAIVAALVALGLIGGGATYVYNEINDEYKDDYYEYEYENKGVFERFAKDSESGRFVDQMPWRQDHEDKGGRGHSPADEIANLPKGDLSEAEREALLYRREEEKFARDVYIALYEKWDMKVFDHIKESEEKHMEASRVLLERYGLQDPIAGAKLGEFKNEKLQALYDEFLQRGYASKLDAIKVGLEIEELDIKDLLESLQVFDNEDIRTVIENLLRASRNHMRAFAKELEVAGGTYSPKHLSIEEYNAIVNSDIERGRNANQNRGYYMDDERSEYRMRDDEYGNMVQGRAVMYMDDDYQEYSYKKLYDEKYINPSQLPVKIKDYINSNYPGVKIIEAEAKGGGYFEVELSNGLELKFNRGELVEIDD